MAAADPFIEEVERAPPEPVEAAVDADAVAVAALLELLVGGVALEAGAACFGIGLVSAGAAGAADTAPLVLAWPVVVAVAVVEGVVAVAVVGEPGAAAATACVDDEAGVGLAPLAAAETGGVGGFFEAAGAVFAAVRLGEVPLGPCTFGGAAVDGGGNPAALAGLTGEGEAAEGGLKADAGADMEG